MARFRYLALDRSGKQVAGELAADNPEEVKRRLRDLGYFPSQIDEAARVALAGGERKQRRRRVGGMDIVVITRQLADMTAARLPMFRSLSVLVEQAESSSLRDLLETIRADVQQGKPLSEALQRHPRHFPDLYVNMVHAGETSGHLDVVLHRLAEFLEKSMQRRSQVISALLYPAVLITVAIGAVAFILGFLIPKLSVLFEELDQALPLMTRILVSTADVVAKTWWVMLLAVLAIVLGLRWYVRTPAGREAADLLALRAPLVGPIWHKMAVSRLARTLGTMLGGGVPILMALEISGNAVGNRPMSRAVEAMREEVKEGTSVAAALLIHMAGVGEETGQLPEMMGRVADSLDFEVDGTLGRLTTLLEPFIIIVMGGIVGFIVMAVLLPIFQMNATIGR
jgi:type II secretion system protein F